MAESLGGTVGSSGGLFGSATSGGAPVSTYSAFTNQGGLTSAGMGDITGNPGGSGQIPSGNGSLPTGGSGASGAITDIFGAGADLIQAYGSFQASRLYTESENQDIQNAALARISSRIQMAQEGRQLTLTQGAATSAITSNGFNLGGSGTDILRANAQQGALAQAVTNQQGIVQQQAYQEQASAAKSAAAQSQLAGYTGLLKAAGSIALLALA